MLIGYARVSTREQNLDLQIRALKEARVEKIFTEKESTKGERPELAKCLAALRPGDTLVVWKLDRLARSVNHLTTLVRDFQIRAINLRSLTQSIDTTSPAGKLTFVIMAAIAEFERDLIGERVAAGMAAAKARGVHCGRARKIEGQLVLEKGDTIASIAESLKVSRKTVYNMLDEQWQRQKGRRYPRRRRKQLASPPSFSQLIPVA